MKQSKGNQVNGNSEKPLKSYFPVLVTWPWSASARAALSLFHADCNTQSKKLNVEIEQKI